MPACLLGPPEVIGGCASQGILEEWLTFPRVHVADSVPRAPHWVGGRLHQSLGTPALREEEGSSWKMGYWS